MRSQRIRKLVERIAEESTFEVKSHHRSYGKRAIVRPKFRHKLDRSQPLTVAAALKRLIDNSYASAELLAHIALSKCLYHILYRQEKMSAHWGAQLSRKTMVDWTEAVAIGSIQSFMDACDKNPFEGDYLQADETRFA